MADNGDLYWNSHYGNGDGTFKWARDHSVVVGSGWNFTRLLACGVPELGHGF
jgi:hypothetical protein